MDAPANNSTRPPGNTDAINASPDDPPQSPGRLPAAVVAQLRIMKAGGVGSPVRRSPRLSGLPPPQPPTESHDPQDLDESSDDESESVDDVAFHLSRDETPENDDLPPDEPSSVLANRIMRAHDNPSPPPQDLAHPGTDYVPGKDGQFPLLSVSVPPSPFRSINLLERLNQFPNPLFDLSRCPRTPPSSVRPGMSEPVIVLQRGSEPSPSITSVAIPNGDPISANTAPSPAAKCIFDNHPPRSSQHACEPVDLADGALMDAPPQPITGQNGQPINIPSSIEPDILASLPTQSIDPSLNIDVLSVSGDGLQGSLPHSERRYRASESVPLLPSVKILPSPSSSGNDKTSSSEMLIPSGQDIHGKEEVSSLDSNNLPCLLGELENGCRTTSTIEEAGANSPQRLGYLSPHSTEALAMLCLSPERASLVQKTILPAESIKQPFATQPRTPMPSVTHPNFPRTSVQRPTIAPTPVRPNSPQKLNSPSKVALEVDVIYRTPARRVPIETAHACGNASLQRAVQLSTGLDQSRPGRSLTIRAPVFMRPALDDPSRSPAKRVPIADSAASPVRGNQTQYSPARLGLRARSASVEPCSSGTALVRSRSVEPHTAMSKPDRKIKESIFPMVPLPEKASARLPFPLTPGQKSGSHPPPAIPEAHETAKTGNTGTDATLGRLAQSSMVTQLRQPPVGSRIPRIGNKPYARPPKSGKTAVKTTTGNIARAPKVPPFQLACKNNGVGNSNAEVSSAQAVNDQRLMGSLKRKRGAEGTAPSTSHPVIIRQVVPGILSEKYAPKSAKLPSQTHPPAESSFPRVPQPLKFRKVVDGMLSARYAPAKAKLPQTELSDPNTLPPSPLSELSSSNEGSSDEKLPPIMGGPARPRSKTSDDPQTNTDASLVEPSEHEHSLPRQDPDGDKPPGRLRRTSRTRKPAQQQYVFDIFSGDASTRPPPPRRRSRTRTEGDFFMGMSATALKALTTSNTTKNQQTVAVLATEVIRKEGIRPESPTVKARTILQKQCDERDARRRERAQRRASVSEEGSGAGDAERHCELDDGASLGTRDGHGENDCDMSQKHRRGPGDEEDYETPERPGRVIEPLRLEGVDRKSVKQVKWHQGLSTAVYLDEVNPRPKLVPNNAIVRGCLAPTSKSLPLDSLGNLVDTDSRPFPELVTEHIIVKKYLYDNDIEPELIPVKMTRSRGKKSKS